MAKKSAWPLTKVVEVSWFDANGRGAWGSVEEHLEHKVAPIISIGYLLKEDKDQITIFMNQDAEAEDISQCIAIPRSWVAQIRVIKK